MDTIKILKLLNFINNIDPFHLDLEEPQREKKWSCKRRFWWDVFVSCLCLRWISKFIIIRLPQTDQIKWLEKILGITSNESSLFVSRFLLIGYLNILVFCIILPRLVGRSVVFLDPEPVKFILEPESQIGQLKHKIDTIIAELLESEDQKRLNLMAQLNELSDGELNLPRSRMNTRRGSLWDGLDSYKSQLIELRNNQISTLRPYTYSSSFLANYPRKVKLVVNFLSIFCAIVTGSVYSLVVYKSAQLNCKTLEIKSNCYFFEAFELSEQVTLIELLILTYLDYASFIFILVNMFICFDFQLNLVRDFHLNLRLCLEQLRYFNSRLFPVDERQVFKVLQEALIKTKVFDLSSKKGAQTLGSLIVLYFISSMEFICTIVLVGFNVAPKCTEAWWRTELLVATSILIVAWVFLNCPTFLNAYINAQMMTAMRLYWPIRAESLHHLNRNQASRANMSHLMSQWMELEHYWFDGDNDQYFARPLGLNLTYHGVIEAHFYLISVLALLIK